MDPNRWFNPQAKKDSSRDSNEDIAKDDNKGIAKDVKNDNTKDANKDNTKVVKNDSIKVVKPLEKKVLMEIKPSPTAKKRPLEEKKQPIIGQKKPAVLRTAAGKVWEDPELADWDPSKIRHHFHTMILSLDDFRIFVGDLGRDVTEAMLRTAFAAYPSLSRVRIVKDNNVRSEVPQSRGYGFVSFTDPHEFARALREMNGSRLMGCCCCNLI